MIDLDVHTHLAPINPDKLAALNAVTWDEKTEALSLDGHKVGMKSLFHPEKLIARMDKVGVKRSLVSIPPPLYRQDLSAQQSLEWVRYSNAELLSIAEKSDGRFGALFYVPLEHPSLFEALMSDYEQGKYEGIALAAGGHPGIVYSDSRYVPLWEFCEAKKAFVFMHPGTCADPRLAKFYLENLVGNPVETGIAATHLVMANIPSTYPSIRFCLAHAGGIFTSLVGRLERGFDTERPGVDLIVERPLQAAKRFYADCIAHDPQTLAFAKQIFGEDKVVYGSDWPFPMGLDAH